MNTILEVNKLCKSYKNTQVLTDIDLTLEEGEFLAIMGQSGSGKSTLLYTMSGMDNVTSGQVTLNGKKITDYKDKEISKVRLNQMGFIFQHSYLLKNLTIGDNIILSGYKSDKFSRREILNYGNELMEKTGIKEIANHDIKEVSGGQLQRAAICRALINQPDVLFGDEPTGALNSKASKEVMDILNQVNQQGTAIVLVTHDAKVAARATRVIFLADGVIRSELNLGKYDSKEDELQAREHSLLQWLDKQSF